MIIYSLAVFLNVVSLLMASRNAIFGTSNFKAIHFVMAVINLLILYMLYSIRP